MGHLKKKKKNQCVLGKGVKFACKMFVLFLICFVAEFVE